MSQVIDRDLGWRQLKTRLAQLDARAVTVGIHEGTQRAGELATIAAVNEYGSADGHVPERPLWRGVLDANAPRHSEIAASAAQRALSGKAPLMASLASVGLEVRNDLIKGYASSRLAPNAPATVARKGSSRPRVDTGAEQRAITVQVARAGGTP